MKKLTHTGRVIKTALIAIVGFAYAVPAHAQDVPRRVIPSSDAGAIPHLPARGFDFEGLRYSVSVGTLTVPLTTSIVGSRIVVTAPERRSAPVSFAVPSLAEASVPALSVFDRKVNKLFLTAKASDVAALVASNTVTAGPEWMPLEDNIRVWTTAQPFTVPASGTHFFSADGCRDCLKLRGLAGFTGEGTAFPAIP